MLGQIAMSLIVQIGACGIAALIGAVVIGLATKLLLKFTPSYGIRYLAAFCGYIPLFVGRFLLAEFLGPDLSENAAALLMPMTLTVVIWIVLQAAIYAVIIKRPKKGYIGLSSAFLISLLHFAVLGAAGAVVILIAVLTGILPFGNTVTFANVVEPILNSRTVIVDVIVDDDETYSVMHEIVIGSRIRITMSNIPTLVQILDLDSEKLLVLDSQGKTAAYIDMQGKVADRTRGHVEFLRQIIRQLKEGQVEELGEQLIDGQKVIGFAARGQNEEVTIWANAETYYPIRIELQVGSMSAVMKNFEFDTVDDETLVSMTPPDGYTMQAQELDMTGATEEDFVETLRIWAEIIRDGTFPEAITSEHVMKAMPVLVRKLTAMQVSEEEGTQTGLKMGRGMLFHQMIDTGGCDWHYAGAGVKLGDADTAIFWYQPQGSATYRVIYGDLIVKDVAEADLPK